MLVVSSLWGHIAGRDVNTEKGRDKEHPLGLHEETEWARVESERYHISRF